MNIRDNINNIDEMIYCKVKILGIWWEFRDNGFLFDNLVRFYEKYEEWI